MPSSMFIYLRVDVLEKQIKAVFTCFHEHHPDNEGHLYYQGMTWAKEGIIQRNRMKFYTVVKTA